MHITRRVFLKSGGVAMVGMAAMPAFLQRAIAATVSPNKKKMVVLFQRGAMDGLNVVVPFGEPNYYRMRPTIAIPQPQRGGSDAAIDLDGFFGLHPSLAPLEPLFHQNQLAIVQAVGSPDPSRSHFDAQDFMESGTPGLKSTDDGWLNRAMQALPEEKPSAFRAVAFGPYLPLTLQGSAPSVAIPDLKQFRMNGPQQTVQGGFEAMYAQTVDQAMRGVGQETFDAIDQLKKINPDTYQPENGAQYPKSRYGQSLQEIAELFKADVGLEVAFLDSGGWDNHVNEGGVQGQLSNLLRDLAQGIAAFHQDMATAWATSSSSACPNLAAPLMKTAIAAPITATPIACSSWAGP
ncbi:MAG: DUF1501 domain-containing protein [Candidatus Acidiferrales bacterium]